MHPQVRWKGLNKPEQVNEPGTLTHSRFSGQTEACWHSLISATGHVLSGLSVCCCSPSHHLKPGVLLLYLCTPAAWSSTAD